MRGLEITSAAVEANYSPERARTLHQPELVEYFSEELGHVATCRWSTLQSSKTCVKA